VSERDARADRIEHWKRAHASAACDEFAVILGESYVTLRFGVDPSAAVRALRAGREVDTSTRATVVRSVEDGALAAKADAFRGGATHDEVDVLFDGYDLFFPDAKGMRRLDPTLWEGCRLAHSLSLLEGLRPRGKSAGVASGLAAQLRSAARFASQHRLMLRFRY
jgi:hypothetical protein